MALIGLLGAMLGSAVSYFGEKAISDSSLAHEEQHQRDEVRGIARVYREQMLVAATVLKVDYERDYQPGTSEARFFELPSVEEQSRIQSRLASRAVGVLQSADEAMEDVSAAAASSVLGGKPILEENKSDIVGYISSLQKGAAALGGLAEEKNHA
jgi:hypothetical protein